MRAKKNSSAVGAIGTVNGFMSVVTGSILTEVSGFTGAKKKPQLCLSLSDGESSRCQLLRRVHTILSERQITLSTQTENARSSINAHQPNTFKATSFYNAF